MTRYRIPRAGGMGFDTIDTGATNEAIAALRSTVDELTARLAAVEGQPVAKSASAFEPAGAVAAHVAFPDPHPQYLTTSEGASAYEALGAVAAHAGAANPHAIYLLSASFTWANIGGKPTTLAGFGITNAVALTGAQTVAGVKTFSSSPIVPTPTAGNNSTAAASTAYVVTALGNYVLTSAFTWANLGSKPTSFDGLGITSGTLAGVFTSTGAASGYTTQDRANGTDTWTLYAIGNSFHLYSSNGNGNVWSVARATGHMTLPVAASEFYRAAANSTTTNRQPRIWVGGSDPGAAAADGDLWLT